MEILEDSPSPEPSDGVNSPDTVALTAVQINETFGGELPPLFDASLRVAVTRPVESDYPVTVTVTAPDVFNSQARVPVITLTLTNDRKITLDDFFHVANSSSEVLKLKTSAITADRTLAGAAMEWVRSVAVQAQASYVELTDMWRDNDNFPRKDLVSATALELVGPDRFSRTASMQSLVRKAQRFLGEPVDGFAKLTPNVFKYLEFVRDDGYYGGFGFVSEADLDVDGNRVLTALPENIITLRSPFVDLAG